MTVKRMDSVKDALTELILNEIFYLIDIDKDAAAQAIKYSTILGAADSQHVALANAANISFLTCDK